MQKRNVLSALCAAFSLCAASALAAMPDAEFAELCRSGTAEQIQQALADGANPNARRGGEREIEETALMAATRNSSPEALKVLVAAGADVNARNNTGNTALMQAASLNSNPEMLEALLAAGADVNARNAFGATALLVATSQDNPGPFIKPLLAAGADPRTRADDGETPLIRAASYGNAEAIRILLAAGADPKIKDKKGHDALWHVRNADHRFVSGEQADEVIRLLQGGAKKPAAQDAGAFSTADLKRMSTFVSNFVEAHFPDFDAQKGDAPSNPALIRFGIWHNYINNFKSRVKIKDCQVEDCERGNMVIEAKSVAESVKKYFDLGVQHRSSPGDDDGISFHLDGSRYHFGLGDGDPIPFAKVKRAVREGGIIRMTGDIYYESNGEEKPDRDGSFVVTAKPHTWNGKKTWAILSLKRE